MEEKGSPKFEHFMESMNPTTRSKYIRCWNEFVSFSNLAEDEVPVERHFLEYFKNKRENDKFSSSSLYNLFSCLNKVFQLLHKHKLQQYALLSEYIKDCQCDENASANKKKKLCFKEKEIHRFLIEASDDNRYYLVRKAAAIFSLCGQVKFQDLRSLDMRNIKETPKGFEVTYAPRKIKKRERSVKFMIPYRSKSPCYASIVKNYFEALCQDVPNLELKSGPVFYTGRRKLEGATLFIGQVIGHNTLNEMSKDIAKFLELENHNFYVGQCFRQVKSYIIEYMSANNESPDSDPLMANSMDSSDDDDFYDPTAAFVDDPLEIQRANSIKFDPGDENQDYALELQAAHDQISHLSAINASVMKLFNADQLEFLALSDSHARATFKNWTMESLEKSNRMLVTFGVIGYESLRNLGFPYPPIEVIENYRKATAESSKDMDANHSQRQPVKRKALDDSEVLFDGKVMKVERQS